MTQHQFRILLLEDDPRDEVGGEQGRPMYVRWINEIFLHPYNAGNEYLIGTYPFPVPGSACQVKEAGTADEFKLHLAGLERGQVFDLAILDMLIRRWNQVDGKWIEIVGSEAKLEQGEALVKQYARHHGIKKMVVMTSYQKQFYEVAQVGHGALEYWPKVELSFETFRQQLESIFDLPSRYDTLRFQPAFEQMGIDIEELTNEGDERSPGRFERFLVGKNTALLKVKAQICEAALCNVPVLITGETGTGKDVVAGLIHYFSSRGMKSRRSESPFSLNCAEFVEPELLRAELFGHTKGAFTGAHEDKEGLLKLADGSTLFLDEVGLASPRLQGLFLRAFEERSARKVGGTVPYSFDVRFIAATDQDIHGAEVFSRAFLHRLSGMHIHLPPLRERKSDIPLLVTEFMKDVAPKPRITFAAWQVLMEYHWPGNVRQLKYVVQLLSQRCTLTKQKIITRHEVESLLPEVGRGAVDAADAKPHFDRYLEHGIAYEDVKARFLADYVYHQHKELSDGKRTTEAYKNTACQLNCSPSTVKERLRDYEALFLAEEEADDEA
jgi:DNA-binding NtrC family response regulator